MNIAKRDGFWTMGAGVAVLVLLLVSNGIWYIYGEQLYKRGASNLPPSSEALQKLFQVEFERSEQAVVEDPDDPLFGGLGMAQNAEIPDTLFMNAPPAMAVAGETYRYKPEIRNIDQPELTVEKAPSGFSESEGEFIWKPAEEHVQEHEIKVGVVLDDATKKILTYQLTVTKYDYLLGTNQRGLSLAGLLIEGSRWTLLPGSVAALISIVFGVMLGAFSGYHQGVLSESIDYSVQVIETIPVLLLFFLAAVIFGYNIYWVMVAVGIAYMPTNIKLIQQMVRKFVKNQFVESSKELGFKDHVVLWRDIVWVNGKSAIASQAAYCFAFAILAEVTLSYLEIGIQPTDGISWGALLYEGKTYLREGYYWTTVFPALAITISILGFYWLGDGLAKMLDYRNAT